MKITLNIWRQPAPSAAGKMVGYELAGVSEDMSFLEMLDVLNEELFERGEEPVAFDSDCREGICGQCGLVINGIAHGPERTTTCQLHMRTFKDGDTITIEPWRSKAFPIIKDLVVDRRAFDRIIAAGGYISVNTGAAPEAHAMPVPKPDADRAFDHVVTVEADEDVRLARLTGVRGMTETDARARIGAQASDGERREIADTVLDANQPLDAFLADVDDLYARLTAR